MENLINEFISRNITITDFTREKHIKLKDFSNALRNKGYFVYRNATLNVIKYMHLAVNDYKTGNYSLTQLEKKYNICEPTLSHAFKKLGIIIINRQNKSRFNENVFDRIDTEEKAYWLGFIYADGYIESETNAGEHCYGFELSLSEHDKRHLEKFNKFMEYNGDNVKYRKSIKAYRWNVRNKHLWQTLFSKGIYPRKSLILKFPCEDVFINSNLIPAFIRGYFDGDGCITYQINAKQLCSRRLKLLGTKEFLSKLLSYLPCDGKISQHHNTKVYELKFSKSQSITFSKFIYTNANIYLDRKFDRFQKFELFNDAVPKSDLKNY